MLQDCVARGHKLSIKVRLQLVRGRRAEQLAVDAVHHRREALVRPVVWPPGATEPPVPYREDVERVILKSRHGITEAAAVFERVAVHKEYLIRQLIVVIDNVAHIRRALITNIFQENMIFVVLALDIRLLVNVITDISPLRTLNPRGILFVLCQDKRTRFLPRNQQGSKKKDDARLISVEEYPYI